MNVQHLCHNSASFASLVRIHWVPKTSSIWVMNLGCRDCSGIELRFDIFHQHQQLAFIRWQGIEYIYFN